MKDEQDKTTPDLLEHKTRAQRFREKQLAAGIRQYAYWLTEQQHAAVKAFIETLRSAP